MSRELEWIEEENSRLLEQETETIKTSKFRWIVLALFCFQSVANSLVCFAFAAVAAQTQEALQTSQTTVDAFVWGFLIAYLPGTVLSQLVFLKKGFSYCFNAGSLLNLGGCGIRAFAVILIKTQTQKWSWILILIGQILAGIAQPFFFNAPAKISGNWFATSERDLATTLAAMTSPIGNALSQIIPVAMIAGGVSGTEAVNFILLSQAGISLAATILSYFLFRAQPEIPPSVSAQERRVREAEEKNITRELTWMSTFSIAKEHVEHLLCDRHFGFLLGGFGFGLALFNAFLSLTGEILSGRGISDDYAGIFGFALIICGLIGAGCIGVILDKYHAYILCLRIGFAFAIGFLGMIILGLVLQNLVVLGIGFSLIGFFMLPMLPTALEYGVECTYPIAEEYSSGLLLTVGNVFGVILTFLLHAVNKMEFHSTGAFTPVDLTLMLAGILSVMLIFQSRGEYKRFNAENEQPSKL